ncbi:hypothetical protein K456DRAFT_53494 [Colletotrichum gloeosporioides 23]|nr:hypothetical protein K456DRAFT_53494 [Colletotrichum gloeosporioides 23]
MRLRISCVLLVVTHFAVLAATKSIAAAYEKIWLYHAYQIAFKLEGPTQGYILRQLDPKIKEDKKHTTAINNGNKGSLKDGMMTWNEFQWALNNLKGQPELPQLQDDVDKTALNLWNSVVNNKLKVDVAATNWDAKNSIPYSTYIDSLSAMIRKARSQLGDAAIETELRKINAVNQKIVTIRAAEFRQDRYLGDDLREVFPQVVVHTYQVSNPSKPSEIWDVVDLEKTLDDPESEAAIKIAVNMRSDTTEAWKKKFSERVSYYGSTAFGDTTSDDNPFKNEPPFTTEARNHRRVLAVWKNCLQATKKAIC